MICQDPTGAICLNTAEVPRIKPMQGVSTAAARQHHFVVATFEGSRLSCIHNVWVHVDRKSRQCMIAEEQELLKQEGGAWRCWNEHCGRWDDGSVSAAEQQAGEAAATAAG